MAEIIEFTLCWLFLIIIYVILTSVNLVAVIIYRNAYYMMKRTLMIKSVYYLMIALLIENLYFTSSAILQGLHMRLGFILHWPLLWVIPKFILLLAIIFFVYSSLVPTRKIPCPKQKKTK